MGWILILGITFFVFLFPYIRIFIKRLFLLTKIKRFCLSNNLQFVKTHFFWFLGNKKGIKCDFYIINSRTVYSIKLWESKRYHTELFFTYNGRYFVRRFIALAAGMNLMKTPVDSKWKKLIDFNFRYRFQQEWYTKELKQILLINPTCYEIKFMKINNESEIIGRGQFVCDFYIHTLSSLISELEGSV